MNAASISNVQVPTHILVAVDAGALSDHAVAVGVDWARRFDARLEFVHAVDSFVEARGLVPDPRGPELRAAELARARQHVLERLAPVFETVREGKLRADALLHVILGRPARVVLERAAAVGADLIVLGARGRHAMLDFGSTARAVLANATCPVLVQPGPVRPIAKILVPVDLSPESMSALQRACDLARMFQAKLVVLHAFDTAAMMAMPVDGYPIPTDFESYRTQSREEFERVLRAFDWQGVEREIAFVDGRPADQILAHTRTADMIVMGTHGRSRFASALLGSVAYEVLKLSTRPVMVVRRPAEPVGS